MAQRIVTYCDTHLNKGQEIPGATWRLAIQVPGGKLSTYDVDACGDCATDFVALASYLGEHGRPVGKTAAPDGPHVCPECGVSLSSRGSLTSHTRNQHGKRLSELTTDGPPPDPTATWDCPECGREFNSPQGMGSHRRRAHDVAGTSRAK